MLAFEGKRKIDALLGITVHKNDLHFPTDQKSYTSKSSIDLLFSNLCYFSTIVSKTQLCQ